MPVSTHERPRRIDVVAAVVPKNGRILIGRRPAASHLGGLWEFPGGKREPGETLEEALGRELMEELGVTIKVGEHLWRAQCSHPEQILALHFYRCEILSGTPRPLGCSDIAWVPPCELTGHQLAEPDRKFAARLCRFSKLLAKVMSSGSG